MMSGTHPRLGTKKPPANASQEAVEFLHETCMRQVGYAGLPQPIANRPLAPDGTMRSKVRPDFTTNPCLANKRVPYA